MSATDVTICNAKTATLKSELSTAATTCKNLKTDCDKFFLSCLGVVRCYRCIQYLSSTAGMAASGHSTKRTICRRVCCLIITIKLCMHIFEWHLSSEWLTIHQKDPMNIGVRKYQTVQKGTHNTADTANIAIIP